MFEQVVLHNFKSFSYVRLPLSPFTLLVGANASGKSNLREAFRFLHGIARGYTLAEIVGEKWIDGGVRVWSGVRGGATHVSYRHTKLFSLQCKFRAERRTFEYSIDVAVREDGTLHVKRERLLLNDKYVFDTHPDGWARGESGITLLARVRKVGVGAPPDGTFLNDRPLLAQIDASAVATTPRSAT